MAEISNPRFPHRVKVVREVNIGTNANPKMEDVVIIESECRNYQNTGSSKEKTSSGVYKSDFIISMPRDNMVGKAVIPGDKVYVEDYVPGVTIKGVSATYGQINNLGANIWYNESAN